MTDGVVSLIGMPGAGKSTIGVLLAKRMGRPFIDTDILIQAGENMTLQSLLEREGVEGFIRLEDRYVSELRLDGQVIATGGSAVYGRHAMEHLAGGGPVVYLALPLEALERRLENIATRGVVKPPEMTLAELYRQRSVLYERWADIIVDCEGLTHERTVEAVRCSIEHWPGRKTSPGC